MGVSVADLKSDWDEQVVVAPRNTGIPLVAIILGAGLLVGQLAWNLGKRIVKDRVAPVVAVVLATVPLLMYLLRVVSLAV